MEARSRKEERQEMIEPRHDLYVGCDVVCIDAKFAPSQKTTIKCELVEGQTYRIRWLGIFDHYLDGKYLGVKVEGIVRGQDPEWGYHDMPFYARRFRPLVKDPIALFKRIGTDPDFKVNAPEGPLHPDGPLPLEPRRKVKEEV